MSDRIFWTEAEMMTVARGIVSMGGSHASWNLLNLARSAQLALPRHRRRTITANHHLSKHFRLILKGLALDPIDPLVVEPKKILAPAVEAPKLGLMETMVELMKTTNETVAEMQKSQTETIKSLANIERTMASILIAIRSLGDRTESEPEAVEETAQLVAPKKKLPMVVVVGANADQQSSIEKEHRDFFDLRFIKDTRPVDSVIKAAHAVIVMTKFVSHSTENGIKHKSNRHIRVNGGASDVKTMLRQLRRELESCNASG